MAARTNRMPVREAETRPEPAREPVRAKVRTRKGSGVDRYHIPREMIPEGMDLQWNVQSVLGRDEPQMRQAMAVQGWDPVLPDMFGGRFDGMFMPKGYKGEINVGGLVLEYRPIELTMEARAEELQSARHARGVEERKIQSGMVDGIDPRFMDQSDPKARANTFLKKEMRPMAIPE